MKLLERDPHLEELAGHLRQTVRGRGRVVLIGGEAGVGKSALVEEFCERHQSSTPVIRATCDSLSTPGPLGPLLDIGPALGLDLHQMLRPNQRRSVATRFLRRLPHRDDVFCTSVCLPRYVPIPRPPRITPVWPITPRRLVT